LLSDSFGRLRGLSEPHPHDHLFRAVFSSPENALGVFRALLPPTILAALDPGSLELQEGSYVDEELRAQESDLLFRAKLAGRETRLYVLLEHQSVVDRLMPLRLLRYVVRVWERIQRESAEPLRSLPAVIPLVLFHGPQPWSGPRRLSDLLDLPDALKPALGPYVPAFDLLIDDLAALDQGALETRQAGLLGRLALVFLKAATDGSDLLALWQKVKPLLDQLLASPTGRDGLKLLVSYTMSVRDTPLQALVEHVQRVLASKTGDEVMATTAEQLRVEGRLSALRQMLVQQLEQKFGHIPDGLRQRVAAATLVDLERWCGRVLPATSLQEVFASN
jgi:hypothetical protein